ncbi:complement factor H-related protein 4-like isoform X1 [Carassius gibelio]|uniref:complement factor H-related protein 4-like isoform X1 n=1 Tax=Carassius gibelio TaxID=101364 RepID=UPI0022793833|nr:complement factor H-related protein 4-like isoform X1 [Carassius gibelio]XP_052447062.1 complement factor H-related protein 4-like isoform X1 [Carassius gibelio]
MKYWEMILFLLSAIIDVSTNAQEVTCEGEQLINVDILIGHPGIVSPYKPGHILVFRCTDVNQKMHGHRAIECQPDGKWDQAYPTCRGIRCEVPRDQHLSFPDIYFRGDMKLGAKHNYYCESGYEKKAEEATCTQDGWTPNPLCTGIRCEVPRDQHVSHPDNYFIGDMKLGAKHNYYCESGYEKNAEEATCTRDGWTPNPLCTVMTASSKCGTPPTVNNADTVEMTKKEYNTGERVEFICFNKYTLDSHSPFSKYLTCQQGKWTGKVKCLKPCAVTVEEMDERGIEPAFTDQQKLFAPHDDHITFKCQWGKNSVGFTPRHKCNDGVMTLPKCV